MCYAIVFESEDELVIAAAIVFAVAVAAAVTVAAPSSLLLRKLFLCSTLSRARLSRMIVAVAPATAVNAVSGIPSPFRFSTDL